LSRGALNASAHTIKECQLASSGRAYHLVGGARLGAGQGAPDFYGVM